MSRLLVLISILTIALNGISQSFPKAELFSDAIDSIRLNVCLDRNKELLLPGQTEAFKLIGSRKLTARESKKFLKKIQKRGTYAHGRALLTHHSLEYYCYSKADEVLRIEISTLTRNISIYKDGHDGYFGKISKKMGKYLVKMLVRLGMFNDLNEIGDTEGIL